MPFEPISPVGAFTAGPELPRPSEEEGGSMLATAGKIAAPVAVGAGLLFAPEITLPALAIGGGAALLSDREAAGAAFRQENTIGSLFASQARELDGTPRDPSFDPWAEIADTPYEPYYEQFSHARNRPHFDAIKTDIDRENKDRDTLAKSGLTGTGATMAAGLLDWPTLLPGGAVLRTAKGEASVLRSAAITAGAGVAGAAASEAVLQSSQQLRTSTESAFNIGGAAILAGLLGGGAARSVSRAEMDGLAPRVSRDFEVPGADRPDIFEPGGLRPRVEAAPGASTRAREVADAIRETAEEILPAQVRVQVVDSLGAPGSEGRFGLRNSADIQELREEALELSRMQREALPSSPEWIAAAERLRELQANPTFWKAVSAPTVAASVPNESSRLAKRRVSGPEGLPNRARKNSEHLVYHGTRAKGDFARFDPGEYGTSDLTDVVYFTNDPKIADYYADPDAPMRAADPNYRDWERPRVMPAYIDTDGFKVIDAKGRPLEAFENWEPVKREGYKGVILKNVSDTSPEHGAVDARGRRARSVQTQYVTWTPGTVRSALSEQSLFSIRAYHGTPHDFDRFDMGKIGTGEGAQVFGHGLYFAEAEGVAKNYQLNVSEQLLSDDPVARRVQRVMDSARSDDAARDALRAGGDVEALSRFDEIVTKRRGNLYEVDIDVKPEQLLDWDKPLEQQADSIRQAFERSGIIKIGPAPDGIRQLPNGRWAVMSGDTVIGRADGWPEKGLAEEVLKANAGQREKLLGRSVGDILKDRTIPGTLDAKTERLREAGIPGIRYLDAGSRDAAEGTRNIVIFDDSLVKITKKNGEPVTAAERKAAVDQLFGVRKTESGTIAEGRFDPETLLITIAADALDPAKTLRHESIHALKRMGLFTGKEWGTLESAARKQGWVESNNVRALYEEIYKGRGDSDPKASLRAASPSKPRTTTEVKVFHGTGADFERFDPNFFGQRNELRNMGEPPTRTSEKAFFFTDDPKLAEPYAEQRFSEIPEAERSAAIRKGIVPPSAEYPFERYNTKVIQDEMAKLEEKYFESGGRVLPAFVETSNFKAIDMRGYKWSRDEGKRLRSEINKARKEGKSGLIIDGMQDAGGSTARQYAVWGKGTVRSALSDNQLYSVRGGEAAKHVPLAGVDPKLESLLLEEAIAEQFSLWRQGASKVTGVIAKLFERVQQFLDRTGNALRGRGFQTADDVFAAVRGGDVASRAPGALPAAGTVPGAAGLGRATSVGASAVDRADDTLKSAFGMEKAMSFQDPMLRLQTSQSAVSRRYVQELAETPLTYEKNALGEETAPLGSEMGAPGAVETRIKFWHGPLAEAMQSVDNAFLMYRKGHAKRFIGEVLALTMNDTIFGTQALTYPEFKVEISKALRRGDQHDIPEVTGAARIIRQKVLDPLKDEAIEFEMLPEGVTPETAASYLNRVYNKERIIKERDQVKAVISDWLTGQETINQGVRARLAPLLERIDTAETDIAKLEERIPKREAKLKEIEARAEEAGRVQQFAFKRALERREPIEAQRARIADLGEQIEGPLDSLASVRGLESRITDAMQIARAMREGDGGDLAAHLADVADLEEKVDDILVKAQTEIERMAESGDLPTPKVEGRYEGPALPQDEIDDIAASWRFAKEMRARRKPESLTSFVVRSGGVEDPGGDVLAMIGRKKDRPGLIRKGPDDQGPGLGLGMPAVERTNTLDAMALRAQENGFFADKTERPTINEFLDALRADAADGTVVRTDEQGYFDDLARAEQFERDLDARGLAGNKFRTEGQVRLFLGQTPSDAFAGEANAGIKALRAVRQQLGEIIGPYRDRISTLTKDARRKERSESLRQSERGVFATQSRNRGRTLADQAFERRGELDKLRSDLERKQARLADAQKAIEDEVVKYQGKSAKDAKSALEGRDEAEQLRQEKRQEAILRREELQRLIADEENALVKSGPDPKRETALQDARAELTALDRQAADPKRLRGADKPVLTAARKIAAQLDKEPGEIQDLADQIIDRILGTPDGRLPYDAHLNSASSHGASVQARGPLAARQFMIPDVAIERWLENDVETLLRTYTRTMSADVELTKRFGSADMKLQIKEIAEDYAKRSAAAKTPKERKKLHDQRDADIRDLAAIRDRLRGTYRLPSDPNSLIVRAGRVISSLNYMRMLGGMLFSAIPDIGGIVFHHGIMATVGDGLIPLLRNWGGARLAMVELKTFGTALDMTLDSRAMGLSDIMDDFGRHTKFERAVHSAARNFGIVSLMAPWNAGVKQFTGLIVQTGILRAAKRLADGRATKKDIEKLAAGGISQGNARKIAEQFAKHGLKERGVWQANTAQWDAGARPAIEAFRAAVVRDVDKTIITPGQDRPLWMSSEAGRLIGQFKSFSISAMQRLVIAGLQQSDTATLSGIILMTTLGGLVGMLKAKVAGQPMPGWDDPKKRAQLLVEAIDRSGLTGWLMDANSMTEKMTRGAVGLSAITGKPVSRYAQRNIASSLLGPTAGTIQDFARVAGAAASGEWSQSDSRVARRLIPYNNLFYVRRLFDEAEAGMNTFLGVPMTAATRH